jgi:glucose/arabinose dehydrogenase
LDDASGSYLGRPVDVAQLPDGSLLVSDDTAGAIYRIWYEN